jgi:hypothetical protein
MVLDGTYCGVVISFCCVVHICHNYQMGVDYAELHIQRKDLTIHGFIQCSGALKMLV